MGEHKLPPHLRKAANLQKMGIDTQHRAVSCNVGHNGKDVIVAFSQPLHFISFTEEQAESHILALQKSLEALRAMKAAGGPSENQQLKEAPSAANEAQPS